MNFADEIKVLEASRKKSGYGFAGNPAFAPHQRRVEIHPNGVACVDVVLKPNAAHEWSFVGAVPAESWKDAVEKAEAFWATTPKGAACRLLCWHPSIRWDAHENSKKLSETAFNDVVRSNPTAYKIGSDDFFTVLSTNVDNAKQKTQINLVSFPLPAEMKAKISGLGNVFVESAALVLAAGAVPAVLAEQIQQQPDAPGKDFEHGSCLFVCGDGANLLFLCFREGELYMSRKVNSSTPLLEVLSTIDSVGGSSAFIGHFSIVGDSPAGGIPLMEDVKQRGTFKFAGSVSFEAMLNIPANGKPDDDFLKNNFIPMASYASSFYE